MLNLHVTAPAWRWGAYPLSPTRADTARSIIEKVARKHGLCVSDLTGRSQKRPICHARFEAAWLLHRPPLRLSQIRIGKWLGGRDHSTISNAIRRHEELTGQH